MAIMKIPNALALLIDFITYQPLPNRSYQFSLSLTILLSQTMAGQQNKFELCCESVDMEKWLDFGTFIRLSLSMIIGIPIEETHHVGAATLGRASG